jgi:glycosyltransferase involved in cell wall biosynthesis
MRRVLMWEHFAPGGPIRVGGHHFAERFRRRGDRVAWCAGPISPINFVKSNAEIRARRRLWWRGGEWSDDRTLFSCVPLTLLPYRPYPLLDRRVVQRHTLRATLPPFARALRRAGFEQVDLLWMSPGSPFLALVEDLPHDLAVYRMSDDTAAFPDTPRGFAALEQEVCGRVDLVVATARRLAERARRLGARRVLYLPNACDPEPFADAGRLPEPPELRALPRPRAVYAGGLDHWFDAPLLAQVARRLPRWSFVLIGPPRADLSPLARLPNVALLGARPPSSLPAYLGRSDAGLVPFRLTPMTHAIHPIKIYEYLAAGLPVVATPMEETAAMGAPIRLAADAAGFATALEEELAAGAAPGDGRRAFARRHTWDGRFATVVAELQTLRAGPPRRAAAGGR